MSVATKQDRELEHGLRELRKRVANVRLAAKAGDDEGAHSAEDDLREEALRFIRRTTRSLTVVNSDGPTRDDVLRAYNAVLRAATLALSTGRIKFERWTG